MIVEKGAVKLLVVWLVLTLLLSAVVLVARAALDPTFSLGPFS